MWKTRILFYLTVFVAAIALAALHVPQNQAFVVLAIGILIWFYGSAIVRHQKRVALLDDACDPDAFLEKTEEQMTIIGKRQAFSKALLTIDLAAGNICQGNYVTALTKLNEVDHKRLSERNNTKLVWTINKIICLYELGRLEEAEALFETKVTTLPAIRNRMKLNVDMLVSERYFFLDRYTDYRNFTADLLENEALSKRNRLNIQYRLAQINEAEGFPKKARELYNIVVREGNRLAIASDAALQLQTADTV